MATKMPKEILVYVCDYDDGQPIFAAVRNMSEIPEDVDGEKVGVYILNKECKLKIKRELS